MGGHQSADGRRARSSPPRPLGPRAAGATVAPTIPSPATCGSPICACGSTRWAGSTSTASRPTRDHPSVLIDVVASSRFSKQRLCGASDVLPPSVASREPGALVQLHRLRLPASRLEHEAVDPECAGLELESVEDRRPELVAARLRGDVHALDLRACAATSCRRRPSMRRSAPHATARSSRRPTTTTPVPGDTSSGSSRKWLSDGSSYRAGQLVVQVGDELDRVGVLERRPLDDERCRRAREPERVRRGAVASEELQTALGVVDRRELAGSDPPQHDPGAARREPLATAGEELGVVGSVGEVLERRDRRPDRHVHDDHRVGIGAERGGVAVVGLQPPHEPG